MLAQTEKITATRSRWDLGRDELAYRAAVRSRIYGKTARTATGADPEPRR